MLLPPWSTATASDNGHRLGEPGALLKLRRPGPDFVVGGAGHRVLAVLAVILFKFDPNRRAKEQLCSYGLFAEPGENDEMTQSLIVAQFNDYAAAHRAFGELLLAGIRSNEVSIIAGDHSRSRPTIPDFGILEAEAEAFAPAVRRGRTLLAVFTNQQSRRRIADIIGAQGPADIEELQSEGSIDT